MDTVWLYGSWILNFVPVWAWITIVIVVAVLTYQIWLPIWTILPKPVKILIGAVAGAIGFYLGGRYKGAKDERDVAKQRDAQAVQKRSEKNDEIKNLPDTDVDKRLNKWMRDR